MRVTAALAIVAQLFRINDHTTIPQTPKLLTAEFPEKSRGVRRTTWLLSNASRLLIIEISVPVILITLVREMSNSGDEAVTLCSDQIDSAELYGASGNG